MSPRFLAPIGVLLVCFLTACGENPTEVPGGRSAPADPAPDPAPVLETAALAAPLNNRCGHQLTGVAWDGTYYYVAEGQFGALQCIIRYTATGEYVDQRTVEIDMRGLTYVPATGKLVTRRYNAGFRAVDYESGAVTNLTDYAPSYEQFAPAPDPDGQTFWTIDGAGQYFAEQHRLSDNAKLKSFPITSTDPYVIGVSSRWVYTVDGTTVRIYSKLTGIQVATKTLSSGLGCQGWGFGASFSGDRILYVRSCDAATAELTGMTGKGLVSSCGHQLTGIAWDGTYYYVAEGQFGLDNCISRFTADSQYVDQRMVSIDMRGLHYVPATGKLVTRHYNSGLMAVDYATGAVTILTGFQPGTEQYAPAPDPDGSTFWVINGSAAERHRLSDNTLVRSISVTTTDPYVIGASDRWIYTVAGTTIHIYSKLTGYEVATRTLGGALGCQGWGFGASATGDRLLSVRSCSTAAAELTGMGGKGLASVCGRQLTGVAWDGTYYYVAEGQFGLDNCLTRYTADSQYVDQRLVSIDMRGLHYVPATGKLVTRHYNAGFRSIDYGTGVVNVLTSFPPGPEQFAPAPDPAGATFWLVNGAQVEEHRISDNGLVRAFAVTATNPYVVGVTDRSILTVEGTTVHVYDKASGIHVGTRALAGTMGCQGWGFGAGSAGDRLLYVRTCALASAETVTLPTPGTTPAGSGVTVQPLDAATGQPSPIGVTFASVSQSGVTSVTPGQVGAPGSPAAPNGYRLGTSSTYYDISTTAGFSGTVTVCLNYGTVTTPTALRLLHGNPDGSWTDITASLDQPNQRICGQVSSLSPFLVAEVKQSQTIGFEPLPDRLLDGGSFTLSATASSALPVSFALGAGSAGCTLSGTTVALVSVTGSGAACVVMANQDGDGNFAAAEPVSRSFAIRYHFSGFYQPVDNPGAGPYVVNSVNAGRAVPVKFGLAGNQGLAILETGSPSSGSSSACSSGTIDDIEQTSTATTSGLSYDAAADQYTYTWKTDGSWAGQCRKLTVTLKDGTRHEAIFKFKK